MTGPALAAAALIAQAGGDLVGAVRLIDEFDEMLAGRADWHRAKFLPEFVDIFIAAGSKERGAELVDSIEVTAGRTGPAVIAARALLAEADGDFELAVELNDEAAAGWEEFAFVLGRGETLLGAGRCLLELGRRDEATPKLAEARRLFAGLDAGPLIARVDALVGEPPVRARA